MAAPALAAAGKWLHGVAHAAVERNTEPEGSMKGPERRLSAVLLAFLAACGGEAIAPERDAAGPVDVTTELANAQGSGPFAPITTSRGDTTFATFTVHPLRGGKFAVGAHQVDFPAFSICDPATSGYGPATWDLPCQPTFRSTRITAKAWTAENGHPQIEFSPALRFVPSDWPMNWVTLTFRDRKATNEELAALMTVLWVPERGATPVNEALTDPTLRARVNTASGTITRRVKHFSGYLVSAD